MRIITRLAAPLAALAVLTFSVAAQAHTPRHSHNSVPDSLLRPFRDVASHFTVAGADPRYVPITDNAGISCIADPAGTGAMGIHYLNGKILFDGAIERVQPEAVVYAPTRHGLKLVALEYIVDKATWDATHVSPPELFPGHPFDETDAPNRFDLPAFYSQHVWAGLHNPLGNLNMWNPRVHC